MSHPTESDDCRDQMAFMVQVMQALAEQEEKEMRVKEQLAEEYEAAQEAERQAMYAEYMAERGYDDERDLPEHKRSGYAERIYALADIRRQEQRENF